MKKANSNTDHQTEDMVKSPLHQFFLDEIKDIYWAEKALVKELPKLAEAASSPKLATALSRHLEETKEHVMRLEKVFASLQEKPSEKKCPAMAGLLTEAKEVKGDTEDDEEVQDVAIIVSGQKVEHYEIAAYGSLAALANVMGHKEAQQLFEQTLEEEKNADKILNKLALSEINKKAAVE